MKKILIVGEWRWRQYEAAFADGLRANGVDVIGFTCRPTTARPFAALQAQFPSFIHGSKRLNRDVVNFAKSHRPDYILFWRPRYMFPRSIAYLRELGLRPISYNNDDPFSPLGSRLKRIRSSLYWRLYVNCLPEFLKNFFYREINCEESKTFGSKVSAVLYPYFDPERDRPVVLTELERSRFSADVVFIGHFEDDNRVECVRRLGQDGVNVRIWGDNSWRSVASSDFGFKIPRIEPVIGDDYAKALCAAKVCLCFMSKQNRDLYTRRCFEIPACGRLLVSERTDPLMKMFVDGREACFFSTPDELLAVVRKMLANDLLREAIANAGMARVWQGEHSVVSRARQFVESLDC